jgi:PAS domain S-box-containing protein
VRRIARRFGEAGERIAALVAGLARQRRAVTESEARFRDFASASGDWFWETDAEGRFTWISPQVEERLGYLPQRYIGQRRIDIAAEGFDLGAAPWKSHLETLARREPFRDLVYRRQTPKGMKWIRVAGLPTFDPRGRFAGYRGSATDVTSAIDAELRARAAEERLGDALDGLTELIVLCDSGDRIVYVNRGFREFNAAVAEHLAPGKLYADHLRASIALGLFPDALGREQAWLAEHMALRRAAAGPVERRRQEGRWLLVQDRVLHDGGIVTFGIDITERKQAEQTLLEREERLRKLFRNSPAAIAVVRFADGVVLDINQAYERIFGWPREEIVGRDAESLRVWADPADRVRFRACLAAEGRVIDFASRARRRNGEVFDSMVSAEVFEEHGERLLILVAMDISERTRAEQRLSEDEQRLSALVTWALDAIIIVDAAQQVVTFNHAAVAMFGHHAEDAIGMPLERLIPERYHAAHGAYVADFAASGTTSRRMGEAARVSGLRADGNEFPAEASITQFSVGGGRFFSVMLRDITKQERSDRELHERSTALERTNAELAASHALLRGILDSTADAILAHDASGRIVAWNRKLVDLSEVSEELLRTGNLEAVLKATLPQLEDPDRFRSEFERISGDPGYVGTRELSLTDGRVLERHTQPIDAGGKPSGRVWSYRDITARVRSEREREADRQFLHTVLDAIPSVVAVTDRAHRNVRVNRAMAELVGRRPEELLGRLVGEIYAEQAAEPGEFARVQAREEQVLASGEALDPYDVVRRNAAHETRHFRARKLPLRDATGTITHVLTVGDDITVLRNAEEQLRRINEELEGRVEERTVELRNALRELESFSYSVSHDLRAPARAVAGFSRIVMDDYGAQLPEEGRRLMVRISKAGVAMGAMVDGLLELSRLTRADVKRQPLDLVSLAAEVWRDLAALEPGRTVEFHMDAEIRAEADPVLLRNLLLNLLGNARKYTGNRSDAAVWLGRTAEGEYLVRDNGVGFDLAHAAKLFGPFQRLHTEREFEGHGIGLALAQKIVERHGGTIRAEAEPGHGATFYFTLGETRYPA